MSNMYGRQVVLPLVNKSGGGVIAGDVVIIDTSNDGAFTTTTTGAYQGSLGVAQETIANNATGRVLVSGYAALVNTSASVTRGHYVKTHTVVKQATGSSSRAAGVFGQFLTGGTTPTAWLWGFPDNAGAAGSTVATDTIWDAAGDLAVGTGADTAAKLAKGNAGGYLAMGNSAVIWNAGTSFPGSKATGDRYFRTDILGGMEFFWDGTQWRSSTVFALPFEPDPGINTGTSITANTCRVGIPFLSTYSLFLLRWDVFDYVTGTNDGSKYYTIKLNWAPANDSADTQIGSTMDTSADTVAFWTNHALVINAALSTSARTLKMRIDKVSTAGTFCGNGVLYYQIIAT